MYPMEQKFSAFHLPKCPLRFQRVLKRKLYVYVQNMTVGRERDHRHRWRENNKLPALSLKETEEGPPARFIQVFEESENGNGA